jgi:hypothetical protein
MSLRLAVHAFNYKNDDLVLRWLANVYQFVDTIYLVYPETPWEYNPAAAVDAAYRNDADPDLVRRSPFADKVRIVLGRWASDEGQRNHVVELARADKHDYLIVQDIDEFYAPKEMEKNLLGIRANPDFVLFKNPWNIFWKTVSYVLEFRETVLDHNSQCRFYGWNTPINFSTSFALNLRRGARFSRSRAVDCDDRDVYLLDGLCCHLSWVKSDAAVRLKVETWTHSQEVRRQWYRLKWENWRPESRWLSYNNPLAWNRAVPFAGELPAEIVDYDPGPQVRREPSLGERFEEWAFDSREAALFYARRVKHALTRVPRHRRPS